MNVTDEGRDININININEECECVCGQAGGPVWWGHRAHGRKEEIKGRVGSEGDIRYVRLDSVDFTRYPRWRITLPTWGDRRS